MVFGAFAGGKVLGESMTDMTPRAPDDAPSESSAAGYQCPYCGAGGKAPEPAAVAAPAPTPSPKMRTMAIDAAAQGTTPIGSAVGWLVPLDGPQTGELFQLKGRCVVGKAPDCDVVLNDPSISGRHAEFIAGRTGFRVTDLGSTNGTYVNDKKITNADLVDNDSVRLGRTNFKFKSMN